MFKIKTIGDFRRCIRNGPYAWPGGYPLYFVMADGEAMSFAAAKANKRELLEALADQSTRDDWRPVGFQVNFDDHELWCCMSHERIEAAYPEET